MRLLYIFQFFVLAKIASGKYLPPSIDEYYKLVAPSSSNRMDNFTLFNQTTDPTHFDMSGLELTRDPIDMLLDNKSNATTDTSTGASSRLYPKDVARRWPDKVVPYVIHESVQECTDVIMDAMTHIEDASCVSFVERTDEENYVNIHRNKDDRGCYAHVGHHGSLETHLLHLGPACCHFGVVTHEMLHNLGLIHEQNRPDRNEYVTVNWDLIPQGLRSNFYMTSFEDNSQLTKCQENQTAEVLNTCVSGQVVDVGGYRYDYDSVMHYENTDFADDGSETLSSAKPGVTGYGQRQAMSILDKYKINAAYDCPGYDPAPCGKLFDLETEGTLEVDPNSDECRWDIIALRHSHVIIEFHTVQEDDCVVIEESRAGLSKKLCGQDEISAYGSTYNEVTVTLMRGDSKSGDFHATFRSLDGIDSACCHSVTMTVGNATDFMVEDYAPYYLGTYEKYAPLTLTDTDGVVYPSYKHEIYGILIIHEQKVGRTVMPWVVLDRAARMALGPSEAGCPEQVTEGMFAQYSTQSVQPLPDITMPCSTTCEGSSVPSPPEGYDLQTDASATTYVFGTAMAYTRSDNPGCKIYSLCKNQDGQWSQPVESCGSGPVATTTSPEGLCSRSNFAMFLSYLPMGERVAKRFNLYSRCN